MSSAGEPEHSPALSDSRMGTADFVVAGKTYKTWYRVHGDIHSTDRTPLLVIHGGPGMTHDYMLPNLKLYENHSIPVIFYDQIGCGRSSFWCVDLFLDELENLVRHLGLQRYDILGHSWGGVFVVASASSHHASPREYDDRNASLEYLEYLLSVDATRCLLIAFDDHNLIEMP
ncbi:hypothetical protein D9613_010081 [Agrocybe pediades]|uniref:AB hydrolase-1 domain-containing protein n=1 Tax=Agrocybe pediades TaxID=84607 RepID=A0A8H4VSM2_9AGAR|nr:hypothetical protein D9613_010081 [Agrocybe pediades]